jgi:tetratricopeptide (TPR) repeat protein
MPRFQRGDFVADGLQVVEVLGEGGFGVVYQVVSHGTGQTLALKALRSELLRDARAVELFRKEAGIWIELGRHPHLVKAEWVNQIGGRLYLAMEYVSGPPGRPGSLEGVLRKGPPPLEQALLWAIEFCHGMEHALSRGIRCHRDIKPANVLIGGDGKVRISDFGIAGLAVQPEARTAPGPTTAGAFGAGDPGQTVVGSVFGTPTHMSPEQYQDAASCDERSDIYSFGVLLYQLASGRLPFYPDPPPPGSDPAVHYWLAFRQLHQEAPPSPLAPPLDAIVARCLRKARAERYGSFAELRADLEALYSRLTGQAARAPSTSEESVADLVNRGISLTSLARVEEALACYDRALGLAPEEKAIHNNRGNALRLLGRTAEALACFERALALDPRYDSAWFNQALLFTQAGRLGEALHCYEQALAYNVRNTASWVGKGHVLGRLGRPAEELLCLDRAIEIDPRDPGAWFNKGLLLSTSDRAQALACYDRALEADPRYAQAWGAKGLLLGETGRHDEALACFDEALRIQAGDPHLHYNKGNVLAQMGRLAEAHACYDAATRLPGCAPIAWYNRALAEHHLQRFPAALASLREFATRAPRGDSFLPGALRLIHKLESGDHSPLRTTVSEERIESDVETVAIPEPHAGTPPAAPSPTGTPSPADPAVAVSSVSVAQAAPPAVPPRPPAPPSPAAVPQATAARPRPPGTAESWNQGAVALQREKRYAEARQASEAALRLDPWNATALNNLAATLFALGETHEAVSRLERALLRYPNHLDAWFNKAVMESQSDRKPESLRSLLEVLELTRDGGSPRLASQAQEARADLEHQGVRAAPRGHLGWLALAFKAIVDKQPERGLSGFDQALASRPDLPELWDWKGSALRELDRLDESLACYDEALGRGTASAELHHGRAMSLVKLRRPEDAIASFDQALALDPEHAASWSDRGKTLGTLARYQEALASFGQASALAPENPAPWQNMALVAEQLGRLEEALSHHREFLKWARPDMRLQVEHAKARVQVLETRLGAQAHASPRLVEDPVHLEGVLAALLSVARPDGAEHDAVDRLRKAGRREEALVRLAGPEAVGRYLASAGSPEDLGRLREAMREHRAKMQPAPAAPGGGPPSSALDEALAADPALRALVPFADVSSAEMAEVKALMDAGREDEAFAKLAAAEERADAARGGPEPGAEAASQAALGALMAIVDQRVAEQMAAPKAGPATPAGPELKPKRPGSPVARKFAERAVDEIKAGQHAKALESLDQAIARDSSVASFFSDRGRALARLGRAAEARASYEKALALDSDCVPALVDLAGLLNGAGSFHEALALAGRAVGAAMGNAAAWATLGSILVSLKVWVKASQAFLVAVKLDPADARLWIGLGQSLERQDQHTAALEALNQGLKQDPNQAEGWYQKGNALIELGRVPEAVEAYQKCVGLEPTRANAWYNLGFALNEAGRHAEAIAPCERAIALHPGFDRAWVSKGVALNALGKPEEALAAYDGALGITPDYGPALDNKGDLLLRAGRREEALACYDRALASQPRDGRALRGRAETLDQLERREEAVAAYEAFLAVANLAPAESRRIRDRIAALTPKAVAAEAPGAGAPAPIPEAVVPNVRPSQPPPDCQKRGEMALSQGQRERALEWFDQAIAGDPGNYLAWAGKADALFALKRYPDCVAHANKALAIHLRSAPVWQRKALALQSIGRPAEALEAWDHGLELAPKNLQLWNGRGLSLIALGRDAEAVSSFEQALAVDPRFSLARFNQAAAQERLGRYAEAARSYQQFIAVAPPHLGPQIQEARRKIQELQPS